MSFESFISSALVSSLLIFALTLAWEKYKEYLKFKALTLLLFLEVNDHLYRLSNLDALSSKSLLEIPDLEWSANRHFIATRLSYKKFCIVVKHYRSLAAARKILKTEGYIPEPFLSNYIFIAIQAHDVLGNAAKLKAKDIEYYNQLRNR